MAVVHPTRAKTALVALAAAALAACGTAEQVAEPPRPTDVRATIARLLPAALADKPGWAVDIYAAMAALELSPSTENICAVLAVTEQESSFQADPRVPNLGDIARREIEQRADRAGVPKLAVTAALALDSPDGRSWGQRIEAATTERQLSEIFEELIGAVPLGRTFFASANPVRTGGPMQVSVAFAEAHTAERRYPYAVAGSTRREVFTRRGGLYFGIAHLLAYEAPYQQPLYRFADFNAGRWASRNAAFQQAVSAASGIPLVLDGDLLPPNVRGAAPAGSTELATVTLAGRLDMSAAAIRRDLERGDEAGFEDSRLWERVFALADRLERRTLARAVVPRIDLQSPKIRRKLTTAWFAQRVDERHQRCVAREAAFRAG